jgi:nitrogenase subunit NifH
MLEYAGTKLPFLILHKKISNREKHVLDVRIYKKGPLSILAIFILLDGRFCALGSTKTRFSNLKFVGSSKKKNDTLETYAMLASNQRPANAQNQIHSNYSKRKINVPLYLFVFLKKKIQHGKILQNPINSINPNSD